MATPKTWTADDLKMGVIRLELINNTLSAMQGYTFIDDTGTEIEQLPKRIITANVLFSELSATIQQALIDINNYMYDLALSQEGME